MKGALTCGDFRKAGRIVAADVDERYALLDPVVVIDSREAVAGSVFVALPGDRTDGHRYVADVFAKGAAWVVVSREWHEANGHDFTGPGHRFVVADDPVEALQTLGSCYRERFDIPVIGVGGSNGKTTTKEMLAAVLGTKYAVHMSQGNRNNHLGVPLTLLQMRRDTGIAVVEMGINHPGEMEVLCGIARPTHGLLTNIGHEHLEFFGSLDGVAEAEAELFRFLDAHGGTAFVNMDDARLRARGGVLSRKVCFGTMPGGLNGWWAEGVSADRVGRVSFDLCSKDCRQPVSLQFIGRHNVINALCAATVGNHFGVGPLEITAGLEGLMPAKGWKRMELLEGGGIVVLNDTYNANPDSVRFALDTLAGLGCGGKKIAVIGDMLELGDTSAVEHEGIGNYIQQVPVDGVCTYGEMSRLCCSNSGARCLGHFDDMDKLNAFLAGLVAAGDAVLFKGSRGMKLELAAESLIRAKTQG
ncbi:MAG: UDP-N-acetylmuramoyl-tripeptide--D-alanyl-D-alanine ligase [Chlorobiaceae bacterium]|nr:UDP-N-acetylmuramoyl-tripeptide--D-alanyl-D-alanine ligase [Chlorobiaceae bacterium]